MHLRKGPYLMMTSKSSLIYKYDNMFETVNSIKPEQEQQKRLSQIVNIIAYMFINDVLCVSPDLLIVVQFLVRKICNYYAMATPFLEHIYAILMQWLLPNNRT